MNERNTLADVALLIGRVAVGLVFAAHGWQKIATGPDGVAQMFAGMGIPLPEVAALVAILIEFAGGIALVVGFALPVVGVLLAAQMAAAYVFAHVGDPLLGGYELPLVLGAAGLALGFAGGSLTLDRLLPWGRKRHAPAGAAA
ncbi:DoxX family protein [Marinactinospora thermotolerans]|uniref:Putative oxidoreductase n=1 Tax=Marinactinospora thermotolerans DSM 45154 TaxID=1122192 RepID=A0A1T4S3D6_9ACTN|nr:DoxX family protein [Marinactinospora thermotolerans]SKA22468.1 putative oxidoreductase [Marinactinospora thermotolerans DSM 45154]